MLIREKAGLARQRQPGRRSRRFDVRSHIEEIATIKLPDLNAYDMEAAKLQVRGTARSMGIEVK